MMSRCERHAAVLVASLLPLLVPAGDVSAQRGGRGGGNAGVTVAPLQDLRFGTVIAGTIARILPSERAAGKFDVRGPAGTPIVLTFSLPASLDSGATRMPVEFGPNSAAWSTRNRASTATPFDPVQGAAVTMPRGGLIHVWLGGAVTPPATQAAGPYVATITLTVVTN